VRVDSNLQNGEQPHFSHSGTTLCYFLMQHKCKNIITIKTRYFGHIHSFIILLHCAFLSPFYSSFFLVLWNLSPLNARNATVQCHTNSISHMHNKHESSIVFTLDTQSSKLDYTLYQFYQRICYFLCPGLLFCHLL